ncbi:MAG TPA: hypothetical protein VEY09_16990 [Pyrinomonadaceae bacterium]|nr:hypothetical protein [Pyrinomonadaceae bacterium]
MRALAIALCLTLVLTPTAFALDSKKAAYIGGTAADFKGAKKNVEGTLALDNERELRFSHKFNGKAGAYAIPYDKIIDIEYGHKTGRRVGAAVATALLISPVGLFLLFSKKRKHYVTVGYSDDEGKEQVAVFELGKDLVRTALPILETRSGKKIEYQEKSGKDKTGGSADKK